MSKKPINEPPRKRSAAQEFLIPGLIFGGAIIVAFVVLMFGDSFTGSDAPYNAVGQEISPELVNKFEQEYDKLGVSAGPEDAELVVREFADYQCPACGAFAPTVQRIREEYADTGKLKFVFFDLPLSAHNNAQVAASAARCAARQGSFWPFHEKLFATQRDWSASSEPLDAYLDMAVETGISAKPLRQCVEQGGFDEVIARNAEIAREVGVTATPTLLIGRQAFSGVTPYDKLQAEIDNQLAQDTQAQ